MTIAEKDPERFERWKEKQNCDDEEVLRDVYNAIHENSKGENMRQDQIELQEKVNEALQVELKNARDRYGDKFADYAHFYGAFELEKKEFFAEVERFSCLFERRTLGGGIMESKEGVETLADEATKIAMEAIQVACVCTKWLEGDK